MVVVDKYYKAVQQPLLRKTSLEEPVDFFFCQDFGTGEPLLLFGTPTPAHKKVFREAGKGKNDFDKSQIAIGTCFVLKEDNDRILCLQPETSLGKAKQAPSMKILNKLRRASMKKFAEIRWLTAPMTETATDEEGTAAETTGTETADNLSNEQSTENNTQETATNNGETATGRTTTGAATANTGGSSTGGTDDAPMVPREDVVKRAQELQKGIDKLKDDLMPRYKEQQTTPRDGAFVKALTKAALIFLTKLTQTDAATKEEFSTNKEYLDVALPQWKELERRLSTRKANEETRDGLKAAIEEAVQKMNEMRKEVKTLLKRVDLKTNSKASA